jgi:hypothetical protein
MTRYAYHLRIRIERKKEVAVLEFPKTYQAEKRSVRSGAENEDLMLTEVTGVTGAQ